MRRARLLRSGLAGSLALAATLELGAGCGRPARPGLPPRNVVIVTVEDLRPDRMSAYAYARPTTWLPSDSTQRAQGRAFDLDELARTGVVFARAYAPGSYTIPSLVTLFTGCSPPTTGVLRFDDRLRADHPTLAERLAAEGFECAAFVTHTPPELGLCLERGFAPWFQCADDAETLARARQWVEQRDFGAERPFLLWLHLGGLVPPFRPQPGREPERFAHPPPGARAARTREFLEDVRRETVEPLAEDWRIVEDLYDDALSDLSRALTAFLAETFDFHQGRAEASETWARTLFVLTAPSGTDFLRQQRALGHARNLCEAELRVPLVLRHPDSLTGERVLDEIVELADVAPTVLEWLALPPSPGQDGRSLLALTDRGREREPRPACATLLGRIHGVRDARWRLIWDPERVRFESLPHDGTPESGALLFDLGRAGREEQDVAALHPEVIARLCSALERWLSTAGSGPP